MKIPNKNIDILITMKNLSVLGTLSSFILRIKGEKMNDKNLLFDNTIRIFLFIILAIVFDKWWIIFFSLLFLNYKK